MATEVRTVSRANVSCLPGDFRDHVRSVNCMQKLISPSPESVGVDKEMCEYMHKLCMLLSN